MNHVYLDLNVFDLIEKKDSLEKEQRIWYNYLHQKIINEEILTPYSNAHINDLKRGYKKNQEAVRQHIDNIKFLSNDLCIVNYWGDNGITWHYRDIEEFFNSSINDSDSYKSFEDFIDNSQLRHIYQPILVSLKLEKVDENIKLQAEKNPILKLLFPKGIEELTQYAFCEDIFNLNYLLQKDYTVFKRLKSYINEHRNKLKKQDKALNLLKQIETIPSSLKFEKQIDEYFERVITSKNPQYQNVTTVYFRKNFEGFKTDKYYPNSIDDAIHTYYASHCEYYITNDDKCAYKASETYKQLNFKTKVMNAKEYYEHLNS